MPVAPVDTPKAPADPAQEPPKGAEGLAARYYFEGGLRRVYPYHYTYNTHCKERWRNRELVDIFTSEFRDREPGYYKKALESGYVKVNGKPAGPNTVLKNGEVISHTLHRHEPPVTGNDVGIIFEDDDLLVIDKPAGVPVHSTGRYHYNSVTEILRIKYGHGFVPRPCNRLDRLTSGVMFVGKTAVGADRMTVKLRERTVQKEYVARVKGKFPDGVLVVDQPIMSVSPKVGLNRVRATGKEAKTKFRRMAYYPPSTPESLGQNSGPGEGIPDRPATPPTSYTNESEGYSIVHCLPLTGRTHQIRVHLQFLGHPISNDPIYSNRRVFGPELGKNDASGDMDGEIIDRLMEMGRTEVPDVGPTPVAKTQATPSPTKKEDTENATPSTTAQDPSTSTSSSKEPSPGKEEKASYRTHFTTPPAVPPGTDTSVVEAIMTKEHNAAQEAYQKRKGERLSGEKCTVCGTELFTDPGVHELGIFLHAVAYADADGEWMYKSKMPTWGLPPAGMEGPTEAPEWVGVSAEEEIVFGCEGVPEIGVEEGENANDSWKDKKKGKDEKSNGVSALVAGFGVIDLKAAREAQAQEAAGGGSS